MHTGKSEQTQSSKEAFPPVEKRENMRTIEESRSQPFFLTDGGEFTRTQFDPFTTHSSHPRKESAATPRHSGSKEASHHSSRREVPPAHREKYFEKLYTGVLSHRQHQSPEGASLPKLQTKKEKQKVASQVASLLLPFPDAKLPKSYRSALSHTRTRKCIAHKLTAYCYAPPA